MINWIEAERERQVHVKKWKKEHDPPCGCYRIGHAIVVRNSGIMVDLIVQSFSCRKCGRTVRFYPPELESRADPSSAFENTRVSPMSPAFSEAWSKWCERQIRILRDVFHIKGPPGAPA